MRSNPSASSSSCSAELGLGQWDWHRDGSVSWSESVYALLQQSPDQEARWALWVAQVHPDDRGTVERSFPMRPDQSAPGRPTRYRIIRKNGAIIWIEDRRHLTPDGDWKGVFIDVTSEVYRDCNDLGTEASVLYALDAASIGIYIRDFEGERDYWNNTLDAICGFSQLPGLPVSERFVPITHPDERERVERYIANCRESARPVDLEFRIIRPDGEQRWIRERGCYLRSPDGALSRYFSAIIDITQEKHDLAELDESRRLVSLTLETNDIGVWEFNLSTGQQVWSDKFYRIMGYEPGQVVPGNAAWHAVLHPDDQAWAAELFGSPTQFGVQAFTYRIVVAGKTRWIRENWTHFQRDDGSQTRLGLTADVTDWKEREHRLFIADAWLRLAVSGGRIGLWSHDDENHTFHWNDYMYDLLSYRPGETEPSARAWYDRIHPADVERVRSAMETGQTGVSGLVIEYRLLLPGEVERWVEERGSARQEGSSVHHGVLIDITERKALQQSLERSQQRLQLALETGQMGFWSGQDGREYWDDQTYRILGFLPGSVDAGMKSFMRAVHP